MRRKRVPIILLFVIVASMLMSFMPANATPHVCGYVRYWVLAQGPYYVPGIPYCDFDTCNFIFQGPNRAWVWPVVTETFECVGW